jgi:hypothetical protein
LIPAPDWMRVLAHKGEYDAMSGKMWGDLTAIIGILHSSVLLAEYFRWFWPSVLSHRIFLLVTGAFVLPWGALFFLKYSKGLGDFRKWSAWSVAACLLTGVNALTGAFWLWWAPPQSNHSLVLMGTALFCWSSSRI